MYKPQGEKMLSQRKIEAIILYHLYGESEAAAKRFRVAVTNAAKEISASQYEAGVCQCTENLFAVNPDGKCAGCKLPRIDNAE